MTKAHDARDVAQADDLLGQARALHRKSISILEQAEAKGDARTALLAIRETSRTLDLLGNLLGELNEGA